VIEMSLFNVFKISTQGMSAQRERLETASANLANANTTRTAGGGPYQRRDVILRAAGVDEENEDFSSVLDRNWRSWSNWPNWPDGEEVEPPGVQASIQASDQSESLRNYNPGHPDAGPDGYVMLPNVDSLEETVNILSAARSFEANATAFNTAKELARASLRLGEG
jgi:flagellar basal-body rod protein FlgC